MNNKTLIACHECDLVHTIEDISYGESAHCKRCGSLLYKPKPNSLERTLALTVTGAIFFIIANTYSFIGFRVGSQIRETTLATGVFELYLQGMWLLATLVLLTVIIVPAVHLFCLFYIVIPILFNKVPGYLPKVFKLYLTLRPWGMTEIFLLGILVAGIKLVKMATIIPGAALFAFFGLIFSLAAVSVVLDDHYIWERIGCSK